MNASPIKRLALLITLAGTGVLTATVAQADQAARDRGPAPSAAAFAACENQKLGARVTLKTTSNKTFTGTCRTYQGRLAANTHVRHRKKDKGLWQTFTSWF
ncbi:hypothetical protein [Pseudomonas sp. NPDC089569]|uniref:hypothetical protein n=1 Tax=Pseudomonas sp. NPDC089569 TaxID=3390722 RepID=UPI003D080261